MTVLYVIIAILLLGFLVLAHEFGHFTAARLTGVPVHEFAIGFGKKLLSKKKNGIIYSLRMIPFGGFVAFADPEDENGITTYYKTAVWRRLVTAVAGSFMNLLVAFAILIVFCMSGGLKNDSVIVPVINTVSAESPAAKSGIQAGDKIISINDVKIGEDAALIGKLISDSNGSALTVKLLRQGSEVAVELNPIFNAESKRYMVGITLGQTAGTPVYMGLGEAVLKSADVMVNTVGQLLQFLFGLVTQGKGAGDVASPIGLVSEMTKVATQVGLESFISIAVFLSVNLGVFNLLPLPALDGSKVIFLIIEGIRRKPVSPEKEGVVQFVGFVMFILLFVFLAGRDILKLFGVAV